MSPRGTSAAWEDLLPRPAFSVGDRTYLWVDVVLEAMIRGTWAAFERVLVEGLACEADAERAGAWPTESEIEAAGNQFRYERDLLAAVDLTTWLAGVGLSVDDWFAFLQRLVLRGASSDQASAPVGRDPVSTNELLAVATSEGFCSGTLQALAQTLAGRAAVVERSGGLARASWPDARSGSRSAFERVGLAWFPRWSEDDLRGHVADLEVLAERFDDRASQAARPPDLEEQLRAHRLEWLRVDLEWLHCPDLATAAEALLCAREDGLSLAEVSAVSRCPLERRNDLLEDLEPERRDVVLSAEPGHLLGPLPGARGYDVLTVTSKQAPTLDDADVAARARAAVVTALVTSSASLVRWPTRS